MTMMAFTFRNRSGREAVGLRAMFSPSRTSFLGHQVSSLPEGTRAVEVKVNQRAAELLWEPPIPPEAEVTFTVDYAGEAVVVDSFAWRDAGGVLHPSGELTLEMELLLSAGSIEELAARALEMDARRCSVVAGIPDSKQFHQFFCEFDSKTNAVLFPAAESLLERKLSKKEQEELGKRGDIIDDLLVDLQRRVLRRAAWAKDHPGAEPPDLPKSPESDIIKISALQLEIFRRHFPDPVKGIDDSLVWDALEMFANGELKVHIDKGKWKEWDAEPRGAFLFFFAEFAFMADDEGVDPEQWRLLMRPLVAIQEVYTKAYRPDGDEPEEFVFRDYGPSNHHDGAHMMSADEKQALRDKYKFEGLDEEQLKKQLRIQAGLNALAAFPAGE